MNSDIKEFLPTLLSRLTIDLSQCLGLTWAIGINRLNDELLPLYIFGEYPDIKPCLAYVDFMLLAGKTHQNTPPLDGHSRFPHYIVATTVADADCVLALGPKLDGDPFSREDHALISDFLAHFSNLSQNHRFGAAVASRIAFMQHTEEELEVAREVENRLLPTNFSPIDGLDYYGECQPIPEVGGEFYDFSTNDPATLSVTIGDVSTKGIAGALITACLQASLRVLVPMSQKLTILFDKLNQIVWDISPTNFFTTMFHGRFDLARNQLTYINAGNEAPLLIRENGSRVIRLEHTGAVLGLSSGSQFGQRTVALQPGDVFLGLSDGMSEAETTVLRLVQRNYYRSSSELVSEIFRLTGSTSSQASKNDKTVVAVRLKHLAQGAWKTPKYAVACA